MALYTTIHLDNVPGHVAMEPRPTSGSFACTVHYFNKVSGDRFRPGGIALGSDI